MKEELKCKKICPKLGCEDIGTPYCRLNDYRQPSDDSEIPKVELEGVDLEPSEQFSNLATQLVEAYRKKNLAYGNSFSASVAKYGMIAALTRISDKFNRAENLILHPDTDHGDERLQDTLLDMAAYCIMTVMEIQNNKSINN